MKISIVMGFFLPVPPAAGGATEKSWDRLAREFAARGHEVALFSRRWPGWPDREVAAGVTHVRVNGFGHRAKLWKNLLLDLVWSWRVTWRLPPAELVVINAVALPCWLGRLRPRTGRVVVMPGRMPKGQFRLYNRLARVLATSTPVQAALLRENPSLAPLTRIHGYPINWPAFSQPARPLKAADAPVVIGFIGRIHEEKGLDLLIDALALLAKRELPAWRVLLCGPVDVKRGGSGPVYRDALAARLGQALPAARFTFAEPTFDEAALANRYREIDLFCYPSLAENGETFGVAVVEAMAAGAVPVVSDLACFRDFLRQGVNGLTFDHGSTAAAALLAGALETLLRTPVLCRTLARQAQQDARHYDYPAFAERLLADFGSLLAPAPKPPAGTHA